MGRDFEASYSSYCNQMDLKLRQTFCIVGGTHFGFPPGMKIPSWEGWRPPVPHGVGLISLGSARNHQVFRSCRFGCIIWQWYGVPIWNRTSRTPHTHLDRTHPMAQWYFLVWTCTLLAWFFTSNQDGGMTWMFFSILAGLWIQSLLNDALWFVPWRCFFWSGLRNWC